MTLRDLFRPSYGTHMKVTPKHWWSPRQRRAARLAAQVLDYQFRQRSLAGAAWPYDGSALKIRWE